MGVAGAGDGRLARALGRSADPLQRPGILARGERAAVDGSQATPAAAAQPQRRVVIVIRVPHLDLPRPAAARPLRLARIPARSSCSAFVGLLGIFYISTFIDLADKLFRGEATTAMLLRYFYFRDAAVRLLHHPDGACWSSTLVTIGVMTKNSELIVMRACGISLYRTAVPLLLFARRRSGVAVRAAGAGARASQPRGGPARTHHPRTGRRRPARSTGAGSSARQDEIYHYEFFDPRREPVLATCWVYRLDEHVLAASRRVTRAAEAAAPDREDRPPTAARGRLAAAGRVNSRSTGNPARNETAVKYTPFAERAFTLEPPGYFKTDEPDAELMTYRAAARLHRPAAAPAATTSCRRWSRCSARSRFRSSRSS